MDTFFPRNQMDAFMDIDTFLSTSFILSSCWWLLVREIGYAPSWFNLLSEWIEMLKLLFWMMFIPNKRGLPVPWTISPNLKQESNPVIKLRRAESVPVLIKSSTILHTSKTNPPSLKSAKSWVISGIGWSPKLINASSDCFCHFEFEFISPYAATTYNQSTFWKRDSDGGWT